MEQWRERRELAVGLRREGLTLRAIGERLGVTGSRVAQLLKAEAKREAGIRATAEAAALAAPPPPLSDDAIRALFIGLDHLPLSMRGWNCLQRLGLVGPRRERKRLGDLATLKPKEVLAVPGVGRVTLRELNEELRGMGLWLGMLVTGWSRASGIPAGGPKDVAHYDVAALRGLLEG